MAKIKDKFLETAPSGGGTGSILTVNYSTNSSSFVDTGLLIPVAANKKYKVVGVLLLQSTGGGTINCKVDFPSGHISGVYSDNAGNTVYDARNSSGTTVITTSSGSVVGYQLSYMVEVGGTGGSLKIQIKTTAGTAYCVVGSWIDVKEV